MAPHLAKSAIKTAVNANLIYHTIRAIILLIIQSFKDPGTDNIFNGKNTKEARKNCPVPLWKIAVRKLDQLDSATILQDLRIPPGNQLEALSGNRRGQHSIRINDQYRICFKWTDLEPDEVEIVDYH